MTEVQQEPLIVYKTLSSKILVVAKQGKALFDWAAYIFPVPGICHNEEWKLWKTEGTKIPYNLAKVLFPDFAARYSWRP